jgi:hypothetical protein
VGLKSTRRSSTSPNFGTARSFTGSCTSTEPKPSKPPGCGNKHESPQPQLSRLKNPPRVCGGPIGGFLSRRNSLKTLPSPSAHSIENGLTWTGLNFAANASTSSRWASSWSCLREASVKASLAQLWPRRPGGAVRGAARASLSPCLDAGKSVLRRHASSTPVRSTKPKVTGSNPVGRAKESPAIARFSASRVAERAADGRVGNQEDNRSN